MSPRRPTASGQSRQQIAKRLRDRRAREEVLILEAAEALARRDAAEVVVADAIDALNRALEDLERLGFDADDVAQLLGTDASDLASTSSARRSSSRRPRSSPTAEDPLTDSSDVNETDSAG
jgi:hypothetical protein